MESKRHVREGRTQAVSVASEKRRILEEAASKIGIQHEGMSYEELRLKLMQESNEVRQTPAARIARKALKDASFVW